MRSKILKFWPDIRHKLTAIKIPRQYEDNFITYCLQKSVRRFNLLSNATYVSQLLFIMIYLCHKTLYEVEVSFNINIFIAFSAAYMIIVLLNTKLINRLSQKPEQNKYFLEIAFIALLGISFGGQLINLYFDIQTQTQAYRFFIFLCAVGFLPIISTRKVNMSLVVFDITAILISFAMFMDNGLPFSSFHFFVVIIAITISMLISVYNQFVFAESFVDEKNMQESTARLEDANRQLNEMNDRLERLSVTDQLTQISNRRAFDEYIERMWNECRRLRKPMTIMMIDIDHFKSFNDFYGHVEGDECLKAVTEEMGKYFNRSTDMFARYGGEEFVAVLPFCEGEPTLSLAEKIRSSVEELRIPNPKSKSGSFVTISIGIASRIPNQISEQIQNPEWIVALADMALYEAKNSGRNRIVANIDEDTEDSYLAFGMPHIKMPGPGEDLEKLQVILQATMISVFSIDLIEGGIEFSKEIIAYIGDDNYKFDNYEDFSRYIYKDDRVAFEKTMNDLFSHNLDTTAPLLLRLKCGEDEYSWVSLSIRYMYDNSFNVVSAVGAISDYSKHMREQEINRLMAQGAANYLFYYNFEGKYAKLSEQFIKDFGIDSPVVENAAAFFYNMIYDEDKKLFFRAIRKSRKDDNQIVECTIRVHHPSKGLLWLNFRGMMSKNLKGRPDMLAGSLTDISESVKTNETNKLIIEGCSDCIYVIDMKNDTCQFSSKIMEIANVPSLFLTEASKTWLEVVVPEDRKIFRESFREIIEGRSDTHRLEYRVIGTNGIPVWIAARGKCSFDEEGRPVMVAGSILNISTMGQYNRYIEKLSMSDRLTGLPNRLAYYLDMSNFMMLSHFIGYVIMVDVDDFKNMNSMHGISLGDRFLVEFSALLTLNMNTNTDIYHMGSDLFLIHYKGTHEDEVVEFSKKIMDLSAAPLSIDGKAVHFTLSVSIVRYYPGEQVDEIITNAEIAMRKVKSTGKNKLSVYDSNDKNVFLKRLELETRLRECIEDDFKGFEIYYQPLFSPKINRVVGAEALLRWNDTDGITVPPNVIIPSLQNIDKFAPVESWVLSEAIGQCKKWLNFDIDEGFFININLSPKCAVKAGLLGEVKDILHKNDLSSKNIVLEITEESLVLEMNSDANVLKAFQESGIRLAIDDFGTGYSSLSYLRNLPINEIKIDRSFISGLETDLSTRNFISSVIQLAHSMDYTVCVEGVETEDQKSILTGLSADLLQGFYFSRPVAANEFESKFLLNTFYDVNNLKKTRGKKWNAVKK